MSNNKYPNKKYQLVDVEIGVWSYSKLDLVLTNRNLEPFMTKKNYNTQTKMKKFYDMKN